MTSLMPNYQPQPLMVARGEGAWVWDADGKRYLDFGGGIGVNLLGHCHPRVVQAIAEQAHRYLHTSNTYGHAGYTAVCEAVVARTFRGKAFLCNSGTEALELALKLVRLAMSARHENRPWIITARNSFHGRTYGALSLTGQESVKLGFWPLLPGVEHVPFGDSAALAAALRDDVAAVVLEPIQGNAGVVIPPDGYLARVRELCDAHRALFVLDEVQTGMGRTGYWCAHQYDRVTPDILCLAKGLGGGLPLGAVVARAEVTAPLYAGSHASTFGGNPVACAAALATIQVIEDEGLLERSRTTGVTLLDALQSLVADGLAAAARGRGMMLAIDLDRPAKLVAARCREAGLLVNVSGTQTLRFLPPLNLAPEQVTEGVEILRRVLAAA